jgi:3-oxoacyl-[acyl-carrier-protein] synthase II
MPPPPRLTSRTIELRRVVVTGLGVVGPLGNDVPTTWQALVKGVSGVRRIERFPVDDLPVQIAGQVCDFDPTTVLDRREVRRYDPYLQYSIAAAQEAVTDSQLATPFAAPHRAGVVIGSGIAGLQNMLDTCDALVNRGPGRVSPFFVPTTIANMASGLLSIRFGAQGPNTCVVTACASGTHAIGDAFRIIQRGEAEVMIAGGGEAPVNRLGVAGFAAMRALSTRNDDPARASRPFDVGRDGFVVAEGAGVVVLESLEHALARGARIHAELIGYGMSGDAFHMTQPAESGEGAQLAMERALADGGLTPADVDYVNAHGTSTPFNDPIESRAIRRVFGEHADRIAVSSTKSMTGHALGAAGGLEAVFTVLTLREGRIPPTINLETPDEGCDLDYVPHQSRAASVRAALSNSFGFGGTNAALLFARLDRDLGG